MTTPVIHLSDWSDQPDVHLACGGWTTPLWHRQGELLEQPPGGVYWGEPLQADRNVARYIDHTLLSPDATRDDIVRLCDEARRYGFYSVCVNSTNISLCAELLAGSGVLPICVVGFPLGANLPQVKAYEATEAIRLGAKEIDTVVNIGALKSGDFQAVLEDIAMTVRAAAPRPVKVILETSKLTDEEKVTACVLSREADAAFVKTSTGFGGGGATIEDVRLMAGVVKPHGMKVKASGGVRTAEVARVMIEAGADRLGTSSSVAIVTGGRAEPVLYTFDLPVATCPACIEISKEKSS